MDKLKLILPREKYFEKILQYKLDMINAESSMDGCGNLRKESVEDWLKKCEEWKDVINLPEGYVSCTQFLCIREQDDSLVGMLSLRHKYTEFLINFGGLIGYSVAVNERNKGYCKEILRLGLIKAKEIGINKVIITCLSDNVASRKCIEANDGIFEDAREHDGKIINRYYIDINNLLS